MASGCLLATCFSTNEIALNNLLHCLQRNFPSSSCLICCSQALDSSLKNWYQRSRVSLPDLPLTLRSPFHRNLGDRFCLDVVRERAYCPPTRANARLNRDEDIFARRWCLLPLRFHSLISPLFSLSPSISLCFSDSWISSPASPWLTSAVAVLASISSTVFAESGLRVCLTHFL